MPVILSRRRREVRRNGDDLRTVEREDAVQLREAHVVTDRQSELPVLDVRDDRLLAGLLGLRLAVDDAADLDVEQVDLAVGRDELALWIEDEARVRAFLAALAQLDDRSADERDPVRARPRRHRRGRLAALE